MTTLVGISNKFLISLVVQTVIIIRKVNLTSCLCSDVWCTNIGWRCYASVVKLGDNSIDRVANGAEVM